MFLKLWLVVIIATEQKMWLVDWFYSISTLVDMLYVMSVYRAIDLMSRVFANGPRDRGSIPGRVMPKTQKMVLDATLLNTQYYKIRIEGKVEQSRERSNALPYTSM